MRRELDVEDSGKPLARRLAESRKEVPISTNRLDPEPLGRSVRLGTRSVAGLDGAAMRILRGDVPSVLGGRVRRGRVDARDQLRDQATALRRRERCPARERCKFEFLRLAGALFGEPVDLDVLVDLHLPAPRPVAPSVQ